MFRVWVFVDWTFGVSHLIHRNVSVVTVYRACHEPCVARHNPVNSRMGQQCAVQVISSISRNSPYHVSRIYILNRKQLTHVIPLPPFLELRVQPWPDI
ncbi:hypothetical protein L1987_03572 [Smallanthus sonchifolius]|uniref:Uncharacterized protein n=1 Tax=Smallanthus sonchifolius TaxID=185202 RepID=A0ACB9KB48_9ASTR|nr:hypothetical protein L1987_03572 [Smallanthus sonchifolius]